MNMINVNASGKSFYHLRKAEKDGTIIYTGWHVGEINVGDKLKHVDAEYEIKEVIERRNHAGEFENPEHKKGTFFKVRVA